MTWADAVLSVTAGLLISVVTTPVGVSGAVFLLPVQLSVLAVPNPAVTPTNLLFNIVAGPGALLRYRRRGGLAGPLTRLLLLGTLPGVVVGAVIRVFVVPGPDGFRLVIAALLFPLGLWLCLRAATDRSWRVGPPHRRGPTPSRPRLAAFAGVVGVVGVVGGIYGVGGGSILGPVLVGRGMPVAVVAPAALASTFVTSVAGAATFSALALTGRGDIAPEWGVGLLCGLGGLVGGYLGAHLQPRLPERALRGTLGALAVALAVVYAAQAAASLG
ncbi:TSUP family transporter [Micromonospora fluostatini]|uniref:TSUP family transporter n=1 Tax=Micromonospora sp. JCM 30529 TaxID=3421643 RepID=UPI003D17DAB6